MNREFSAFLEMREYAISDLFLPQQLLARAKYAHQAYFICNISWMPQEFVFVKIPFKN